VIVEVAGAAVVAAINVAGSNYAVAAFVVAVVG